MENTKELIIESAFSFYTKPIIKNISLSSIAAKAGITKPAIYRHFKSRQELDEVMKNRVYNDIYAVLSKIHQEKDENVVTILEDIIVLLLTHKEYLFYLISTEVEFKLDRVLLKFKEMGLSYFDEIFATDGSVTDMEKYKRAIYLGGNIMFFECIRNRITSKMNIQDTYSDIVDYASKINSFFNSGLGQDVSNITMSRLATLDETCRSNMEFVGSVNEVFRSVSDIVKEKGFNGVTVESVAHGIGLAKSSIYDRFENKNQMICSLILEEFRDMFKSIEKNISYAESNAERGYVLMETVLLYFMKKPEVLTVGQWFQFQSSEEIIKDKDYDENIHSNYLDGIKLFEDFPDLGLPCEDKRIISSWFMMMPIVLIMHTKSQNISPDVIQAMLKDILIMMEKGVGYKNER